MGYGIMPELKEPDVCEVECEHSDCKHWKQFVGKNCDICKKPVESGQGYYELEDNVPSHNYCVQDEALEGGGC